MTKQDTRNALIEVNCLCLRMFVRERQIEVRAGGEEREIEVEADSD